ncbi:MAG: sigma-70 family RNA polymerase sigma factor [Candidatus Omnitrophica bacterium]|nr:sigma-70 family RNA polymerase sigma factor [Candidatus Omnitrophota bacterium]
MQDISKDTIAQAQMGDIDAFEKIYNVTSGFVYSLSLRMTSNKEDAEEITQDVFLKIHKSLKRFEFRSSFKTWVYRIAVNTAINFSRRVSKKKADTVKYDDTVDTAEEKDTMRDAHEKEHNEKLIQSMLGILNPDQRLCMILRNIEGLSYEEIAETLKVNINTVRTRLKRAREKLISHFHGKEVICR